MSSYRVDRLEQLIKEQVSYFFIHKMQDEEFGFLTITDVKLSGDLKVAKIYLSVFQKEKREFVLSRVNAKLGQIRTDLAHNIRVKFVPELKFYIDDTLDYVEKIEGLINEIHKQNNNKPNK